MTNEQAIKILSKVTFYWELGEQTLTQNQINEAIDMAFKALEQQPNDDCISREEAIRLAEQGQIQGYEWQFKKLCTLQSATPQQRVGKWKEAQFGGFICSECGNYTKGEWSDKLNEMTPFKYCPNCGAKMEVEE